MTGRNAYLSSTRGFYEMIDTMEVLELIVDGDKACALTRYYLHPPQGNPFASEVAEVFTVGNDSIQTFSIVFDTAPFPS